MSSCKTYWGYREAELFYLSISFKARHFSWQNMWLENLNTKGKWHNWTWQLKDCLCVQAALLKVTLPFVVVDTGPHTSPKQNFSQKFSRHLLAPLRLQIVLCCAMSHFYGLAFVYSIVWRGCHVLQTLFCKQCAQGGDLAPTVPLHCFLLAKIKLSRPDVDLGSFVTFWTTGAAKIRARK